MLLNIKNLKQKRLSKKLSYKYIGLYRVKEYIGTQAYRLQLPEGTRIYDIFYISLLKLYKLRESELEKQYPLPELINKEEEQEIEVLLGKELRKEENRENE